MSVNIFFTSDSHYGHSNIAGPKVSSWSSGYRNFDSTYDMNEALIESFNEAGRNDIIYHLGDWSFGGKHNIEKFRKSIQCENIFLVTGNHDKHVYDHRDLFKWIKPVWEGKIQDTYFYLHHYAQRVWNMSHRGSVMLYGHSHGSLPDDPNSLSIDVGWDTELYGHKKHTLYHYDEIMYIMKQKQWKPVDHHNTNTTE